MCVGLFMQLPNMGYNLGDLCMMFTPIGMSDDMESMDPTSSKVALLV